MLEEVSDGDLGYRIETGAAVERAGRSRKRAGPHRRRAGLMAYGWQLARLGSLLG